jgi:tetratricopeptide (TPR) repeat protein
MGNTESSPLNSDKPGPLALEARGLLERGFHEAAMAKYKRSYDLYKEVGTLSSAGRSLRLAAEAGLQMTAPDYELAAAAFEEVGTLYLTNKITAFSVKSAYANSIFCLLAAGRVATAKGKYDEFVSKDSQFESSLDGVASQAILEAYQNGNRNQVLDRIEAFKDMEPMQPWRSVLLNKIVERL